MGDLNTVLKTLNKGFKTGEIKVGIEFKELEKIPFKSPRLNYMTYGGLPLGRVVEFSGAENSGKTTTSLDIAASAQRLYPNKQVLFVDVESTFSSNWATKMGVDCESIILYRPDTQTAEEVLQNILDVINTGDISLCILDSIACLVSKQEDEKNLDQATMAGIAKLLTVFGRKLIPILARTGCLFIGINQLRDVINSPVGGTTTPGGKAWKHNCSIRLAFRKGSFIDDSGNTISRAAENPIGNLVTVHLEKSKVDNSDRRIGFYTLNYLEGIDYVSDMIDVAIKRDLILQKGAWYEVSLPNGEFEKLQGKKKVKAFLTEHSEVYDFLAQQI